MWSSIPLLVLSLLPAASAASAARCKAFPNTSSWPAASRWSALNSAVSGRLETVRPPAAVCYETFDGVPSYDAAKCQAYTAGFYDTDVHLASPVSIYWDFWTNRTCVPTDDPTSGECTRGAFPNYVIKAQSVKDVQAGVNFAKKNNVRLVIKNTGHDFMGKSIGTGSLSIWTHLFQSVKIIDKYSDPSTSYKGSAVKLGAGVQIANLYTELAKVGKVIVAGECPTVGFAGGYIQGGGHGPLSTILGMGTDSVLQYTLVTADGKYITADAKSNSDIFWAMRGGGGASWGVLISVTVKTHDTPPVSGAVFNFDVPAMSQDTYWAAVEAFHSFAPSFADAGIFGYYELNKQLWFIKPLIAPHKTLSELAAIMAPMMAKFDELGVKYTSNITTHSTFLEGYEALFDPEGAGANMFTSSRLFLREHVEGNNSAITAAFRNGAEQGYHFIGHVVAPGQFGGVSKETSVNPIWKKGLLLPLYNYMWNGTETQEQKWAVIQNLIDNVDTEFKDASPGSGTYINEANLYEPNWQNDFYGAAYPRLLKIKKKVDPTGVFYAKTAVGSELWKEVDGGRLCKA
ncbi:FAD binding domain-containing protein [Tricharina praecox]|uniref:FAD binding domain-containing protein n=1 Tax=Tricharina praecox TaxID=43433 RepID=UPI002220A26C|nr:FAD binding domain-containing protein [Tricharina praecox]KAI5858767.1 FAD binding domain-containing protein [Tricharina praecox]